MCRIFVIFLVFFLCFLLFDYNLNMYFGIDVPWYVDVVGGVCANAINLPAAVIAFILDFSGVVTPFFNV